MRTRPVIVLLLVALVALACGDDGEKPQGESETPTVLEGVITEVEAESLTEVRGFTLRSEGETYEILLDPNVTLPFAPSHLNEHAITGDPVIVDVREEDGKLYALSVEDA